MTQGNESSMRQKMDDGSGNTQVVSAEVHAAPRMEDETNPAEKESSNENASDEEGQQIVEFEDQSYELAQTYQLEDKYQDMTAEQEAAEVQTLMPQEHAEYQEMKKQAEMERKVMGLSHIIKERVKARTPGIPVDLVQRSVKTEVPAKQELHRLTGVQQTRLMVKQDEIPRIEKPGTHSGYYLFVEDDSRFGLNNKTKKKTSN